MPATAWNFLVVAVKPDAEAFGCELRDGRVILFPLEWRKQISVADRLNVPEGVTTVIAQARCTWSGTGGRILPKFPWWRPARPRQTVSDVDL